MKYIEILAPAGTIEKGYSVIAAGCDAIYGGLKFGNARQRAKNFTLEEYYQMLSYCRKNNVKFYLTLNTLLRTDELDEILNLLNEIELPDAVIIADIGLMISVRNQFPDLPVHASTQFGASSLNDIKFLESLGVSRAILSRELTIDEIKYIKDNSKIELEVFVFGTQCTMFSGQCLWGGLITESSGNRGKCNGMCRDLYSFSGRTGQFMYPRDLEIGNHIEKLREIGISSIKIEGRLRTDAELRAVVSAICSGNYFDGYSSYLSNEFPVRGMFNRVNPRVRYTAESSEKYTQNDLLLYNGNEYITGDKVQEYKDCKYIKTVYSKPVRDEINIAVKLKYENRFLKKFSFINKNGERNLIPVCNSKVTKMSVSELCKTILNKIKYNVYELISEVPDSEIVYADIDELSVICDTINENCKNGHSEIPCMNTVVLDKSRIYIQTNIVSDIVNFSNNGYDKFIFEIESKEEFEKALRLEQNIIFRLPVLEFGDNISSILCRLSGRNIMITRISQVMIAKEYKVSNITADYTVNCWNESALHFLKNNNIISIAVHPELELSYSLKSIEDAGLSPSVIILGKIPLGFTRACFGELNICNHKCNGKTKIKNIYKDYEIYIDCSGNYGFRTIYRNGIDIAYRGVDSSSMRFILSQLSEEEKNKLLDNKTAYINNPNYLYRRNIK